MSLPTIDSTAFINDNVIDPIIDDEQYEVEDSARETNADEATDYFTTADEMETELRDNGDFSADGNTQRVEEVECEEGDDTSEWHCSIRFLGSQAELPYFVEVDDDGAWGASDDTAYVAGKLVEGGCEDAETQAEMIECDASLQLLEGNCLAVAQLTDGDVNACVREQYANADECFDEDATLELADCKAAFVGTPKASS